MELFLKVGPRIFARLIFKLGNLKLKLFEIPSSMPTSYVWLQGYGRMCMALAAERERESRCWAVERHVLIETSDSV